jgi:hypothetical protein
MSSDKQYMKDWRKNNQDKIKSYRVKGRVQEKKTINGRYAKYKSCAKDRDISFDISIEEFTTFWQTPCSYCGDSIETIGIDRVDSSLGYKINNIVSCCTICNRMKLDYTKEFFINHIQKILNRQSPQQ